MVTAPLSLMASTELSIRLIKTRCRDGPSASSAGRDADNSVLTWIWCCWKIGLNMTRVSSIS